MGIRFAQDDPRLFMQFETATDPGRFMVDWRLLTEEQRKERLIAYAFLRGTVEFDLRTTPATERERVFTTGLLNLLLSQDGRLIAVNRGSRRGFEAYAFDDQGRTLRVNDPDSDQVTPAAWVPDGSGLLVRAPAGGRGPSNLYMVSLSGAPAVPIDVGRPLSRSSSLGWSPDGRTLALTTGGETYLYDRAASTARLLASHPVWPKSRPVWSPRGDAIVIGGDVIEVATGSVQAAVAPSIDVIASELSPDGRWLAALDDPSPVSPLLAPCPTAPGQPKTSSGDNRIHMLDRFTGETRVALDCGNGTTGRIRWMPDNRRLIVW